MITTPLSKVIVDEREFFIKRDELYDSYLSGNKFRKLQKLIDTPANTYQTVISYGGTQSNAMLSIAALAKQKGWKFLYYTKPLSNYQKEHIIGNYKYALSLGMLHREIADELYRDFISSFSFERNDATLIIHQGGAVDEAKDGLRVLAEEIKSQEDEFSHAKSLATPSGTGTTALFLALNLPEYKVYTTPSVGDVDYLKAQMLSLVKELPKNLHILKPEKKYHFAKPYKEFKEIYDKLLACKIEFDLLYAPGMFKSLLEQTDEDILYIHSGGVSGNVSMLKRYEKKGW